MQNLESQKQDFLWSDPDQDPSRFAIKRKHLLKGTNLDLLLILPQYLAPGADWPKDFSATMLLCSPIAHGNLLTV